MERKRNRSADGLEEDGLDVQEVSRKVTRLSPASAATSNAPADDTDDLLTLLDFRKVNSQNDISARFDAIANTLIHEHDLVVTCKGKSTLFQIIELEFYLLKSECHEDPFTHAHEEQDLCGQWCVLRQASALVVII